MKKQNQLGMNPSTASNRLVKDLLWNFIETTGKGFCCKCGNPMTRDTFSIEHIEPWLDSDDPIGLYFDISNISYSHRSCNVADRRDTRVLKPCGTTAAYNRGCRCDDCRESWSKYNRAKYSPEVRSERYKKTGR